MDQPLAPIAEAALDAARKAGAEAADVIVLDGTALSIEVRAGSLDQAERAEGIDIGLRVLMGQKQAIVSASDKNPETLAAMAERAVAMAAQAPEDPSLGLADPEQLTRDTDMSGLDLCDPGPEPSPAELEEMARAAEAAALAHDGITQVEASSATHSHRRVHLATTTGFSAGYTRTDTSLYCVPITGSGTEMERDYAGESRVYRADLPTPKEIGDLAAERTLARAGARKPPTGAFPVVFDERISSSLIGHLLASINGMAIVRGASWARDLMGEAVLPSGLNVMEDPHRPRTTGSRMFDAEGLATTRRAIVENGVLKSWVLDLGTARKLGLESTASATRGPTSPPSPSAGNLSLTQGDQTRAELLADMGTGLLITSMIGSTINPTTGDYSRGASGYWVENGELAYPVNECTVAGNLIEMLKTITPANDARTHLSRVVPSLRVEGLTIAGA